MNIKSVIIACDATSHKAIAEANPNVTVHDAVALPSLLSSEGACVIAIGCHDHFTMLHRSLELCLQHFGPSSNFIRVINNQPHATLQSIAYEYGVDHFLAYENLERKLSAHCQRVQHTLSVSDSSENLILAGFCAMRESGQKALQDLALKTTDFSSFDFAAAYALGKFHEALGGFGEAETAYRRCLELNNTFRPAAMGLVECLLVLSRVDEALKILLVLEQAEDSSLSRKALLAAAYAELKNLPEAKRYADEAASISRLDPRSLEAKAHVAIAMGQIDDALEVMESLQNVGPFFTAKVNELGIGLSQGGKGDIALALYEKAHRIVRPELKFKISLNAALAAHRTGHAAKALLFLDRCEKEYGASFPKLEKIRAVIRAKVETTEVAS